MPVIRYTTRIPTSTKAPISIHCIVAALEGGIQGVDRVLGLLLGQVDLGPDHEGARLRGIRGEHLFHDSAAGQDLLAVVVAEAGVDEQLGLSELHILILRIELVGLLHRRQCAFQISPASAIRREHHEDGGVVGALPGGLLDESIGLFVLTPRVVEAREQVDEIDGVVLLLDGTLQRRDRLLPALAGVEEARELGVAPGTLFRGGQLEGLPVRRLCLLGAVAIESEEQRESRVAAEARIGASTSTRPVLSRTGR